MEKRGEVLNARTQSPESSLGTRELWGELTTFNFQIVTPSFLSQSHPHKRVLCPRPREGGKYLPNTSFKITIVSSKTLVSLLQHINP